LSGPEFELAQPKSKLRDSLPFIVLSPKLPANRQWTQEATQTALKQLVTKTVETFDADPTRVYVTGYNAGGVAAWQLARKNPTVFCRHPGPQPDSVQSRAAGTAEDRPMLAFLPSSDVGAFKQIADAFAQSHTDSQVGPMDKEDASHPLSHYGDPHVYEWLLKHRTAPAR